MPLTEAAPADGQFSAFGPWSALITRLFEYFKLELCLTARGTHDSVGQIRISKLSRAESPTLESELVDNQITAGQPISDWNAPNARIGRTIIKALPFVAWIHRLFDFEWFNGNAAWPQVDWGRVPFWTFSIQFEFVTKVSENRVASWLMSGNFNLVH